MEITTIIAAIALPFSIIASITGFIGFKAGEKNKSAKENREIGAMTADLQYIKKTIDNIASMQCETASTIISLSERVARIEGFRN
ncbi:MAG: hypothetical protein RR307_05015 [Clostridia bacterium]